MERSLTTEHLAEFVSGVKYNDLPLAVRDRLKMLLLNAIGACLATPESPAITLASALVASRQDPRGASSFWFVRARGAPEECAFTNSIILTAATLHDTVVHTGEIVIPVAVAVGEMKRRTGAEILASVAIGYEVTHRLDDPMASGEQLGDALVRRGFRHSWFAIYGATAAAAYLLGLDTDATIDALALTTTLCVPGSMAWSGNATSARDAQRVGLRGLSERYLQIAGNAKNAVVSAELAEIGFAGTSAAIDGTHGLYDLYGQSTPTEEFLQGLGDEWRFPSGTGVKPYPCGSHSYLAIYCAEQLVLRSEIDIADVASIRIDTVEVPPHIRPVSLDLGPFTSAEGALMSFAFGVAATLVQGRYANWRTILDGVCDPRVDALARLVTFRFDVAMSQETAVTVVLASGETLSAVATDTSAELANPTSWVHMVDRFHRMAAHVKETSRESILAEISELEQRENCGQLFALVATVAEEARQSLGRQDAVTEADDPN